MALHLIIGPMKSGKSLELIAKVSPYRFSNMQVGMYQPVRNVRDVQISSRTGVSAAAQKIRNLSEVSSTDQVIGIDEIHMFESEDIKLVTAWLRQDKTVYISGLDTDYRGALMPVMAQLFALKPDTITILKSVCEQCKIYDAVYSQVIHDGVVMRDGLPAVVPDDGTYGYRAVCRSCFAAA